MMAGWVFLVLTGACQFGHGVGGFKADFILSAAWRVHPTIAHAPMKADEAARAHRPLHRRTPPRCTCGACHVASHGPSRWESARGHGVVVGRDSGRPRPFAPMRRSIKHRSMLPSSRPTRLRRSGSRRSRVALAHRARRRPPSLCRRCRRRRDCPRPPRQRLPPPCPSLAPRRWSSSVPRSRRGPRGHVIVPSRLSTAGAAVDDAVARTMATSRGSSMSTPLPLQLSVMRAPHLFPGRCDCRRCNMLAAAPLSAAGARRLDANSCHCLSPLPRARAS